MDVIQYCAKYKKTETHFVVIVLLGENEFYDERTSNKVHT
jgi:hypothetical protein